MRLWTERAPGGRARDRPCLLGVICSALGKWARHHGLEVAGAAERASLKRSDEVELLPVLAGEDGGLFVVLHQLVHGVEPPLPDAVDIVHKLHLEMFVLPWCFERHGEVTGLGRKQNTRYNWTTDRRLGRLCSHRQRSQVDGRNTLLHEPELRNLWRSGNYYLNLPLIQTQIAIRLKWRGLCFNIWLEIFKKNKTKRHLMFSIT